MRPLLLPSLLVVALLPVSACQKREDAPVPSPSPSSAAGAPASPVPAACEEPFGLVARYDFAWLEANVCRLCGGDEGESPWCGLDWPFSDVPPCDVWDEMRNGVFAHYGYPFQKDRWRARFEREPWYRPDEAFTLEKLPPEARRNVELFRRFKAEGRGCFDEP